ncbi:MAG: hypothetical protein M0Q38_13955 [Bacteroidales bacterium]|jgi:hypothetical protein|nr:hypothetical protein [Bacteroidales bacterium]
MQKINFKNSLLNGWSKYGLFFFICLGLLNFIVSCKKTSTLHYVISEEFKAWADFQQGSYWIYYNKINQSIDSTYVTDNYLQTLSKDSQNASEQYQYDQITMDFNGNVYQKFKIVSSD